MSAKVPGVDLKPGDVLLMQGRGLVSDLIRLFNQGRYSHAAIYDGQNVVEMLSQGTSVNTLGKSSVPEARFVDVYRFVGSSGQPLGSPELDAAPVLGRIKHYETPPALYGYDQIVLLALLCATRREAHAALTPVQAQMLRCILDSAADEIANLIHAGREPMICSELVYRCYTEAGTPYAIVIRGADVPLMTSQPPRWEDQSPEEIAFQQEATRFLLNYAVAKGHDVSTRAFAAAWTPASIVAASATAPFVTPHDLETSPNLQIVGTLE